jgi:hypothetical protein
MTGKERILLAITIIGFIVPNAMVIAWTAENGWDPGGYFEAWVGSLPSAQLTADLVIVFLAFLVMLEWEGRRKGMRLWWVPIPASLLIGICFGFPLFLLMRERAARPA